jgi:HlyD family secretion protein
MRFSVAVLACALLAACSREAPRGWQGYAEGEYVYVASSGAGQLAQLAVQRGDAVKAGQPLFALEQESERQQRLEAAQRVRSAQARAENLRTGRRAAELDALRAALAQAEAARALSAEQLAQQQKLRASGFISEAQLDAATTARDRDAARVAEARAQLASAQQPLGREAERGGAQAEIEAARAALAQSDWRLAQRSVVAPVEGVVQDSFFNPGEWVPAGRPVLALLPPGRVKARFYVPETALGGMKLGAPVSLACDGCGEPLRAQVSFISTQAELTPPVLYNRESRAKLAFLVEARPAPADAARLKPGQPLDVRPLAQ